MFVLDNKTFAAMLVIMTLLGILLFTSGFVSALLYLDKESTRLLVASERDAAQARMASRDREAMPAGLDATGAQAGAAQGAAGAADGAKASAADAGASAKGQAAAMQDQAAATAAGGKDQAGAMKDQAGAAATGAQDKAGAAGADAKDKAGAAAAGAQDKAGAAGAEAKDKAGAAAAGAQDKAGAAKDGAGAKADALAATVTGKGDAAKNAVASVLGGGAAGDGAAGDGASQDAASSDAAADGKAATDGPGDFLVQVGSFLGKQNADRLAHALLEKGYSSGVMTRVDDRERTWFMVYVGRYPDKKAANAAVEKIRTEEKVGALVIRASTGSAARYEPLQTVYSVQAGSFLSEGAALKLVKQLKNQGFDACYYHLYDDADKQWYVAQVGDFADKKDAEAAAAAYKDRLGKAPAIKSLAVELLTERKQCP
ncbi:MAG: SPOR domain-containing protein [Desulfovibrionaceae bacterium]